MKRENKEFYDNNYTINELLVGKQIHMEMPQGNFNIQSLNSHFVALDDKFGLKKDQFSHLNAITTYFNLVN